MGNQENLENRSNFAERNERHSNLDYLITKTEFPLQCQTRRKGSISQTNSTTEEEEENKLSNWRDYSFEDYVKWNPSILFKKYQNGYYHETVELSTFLKLVEIGFYTGVELWEGECIGYNSRMKVAHKLCNCERNVEDMEKLKECSKELLIN